MAFISAGLSAQGQYSSKGSSSKGCYLATYVLHAGMQVTPYVLKFVRLFSHSHYGWNPARNRRSVENEQADAERDGQTRLARPNSQARTGAGKYLFFLVHLTTSRIGNLTRLTHILLYVMATV